MQNQISPATEVEIAVAGLLACVRIPENRGAILYFRKDGEHERTHIWLYPSIDEGTVHRSADTGNAGGGRGGKGSLYRLAEREGFFAASVSEAQEVRAALPLGLNGDKMGVKICLCPQRFIPLRY